MRSSLWQLLFGAFAVLGAGALAACDDAALCALGGTTYQLGDSFDAGDGCNSCVCTASGTVCTEIACVTECTHEGETRGIGEVFDAEDGCNQCTCNASGEVTCDQNACEATCESNGMIVEPGTDLLAEDGCNYCRCENGELTCSDQICDQCIYGGTQYGPNEGFLSLDGCVECSCKVTEDGQGFVDCPPSAASCCDATPGVEWWREYGDAVGGCAPELCPPATTPFNNDCGCGCEQDPSCPEAFDCVSTPCDADAIESECPFSRILQ
jgi:hypothetical protein